MKKILHFLLYFFLSCLLLRACGIITFHEHDWADATCSEPRTCVSCGKKDGSPLGHSYETATCTAPNTCTICGKESGKPAGHKWGLPTCTVPKVCTVCGATTGEPYGHDTFPVTVSKATCQTPGEIEDKCRRCGAVVNSYSTSLANHQRGEKVTIDTGSATTPRIVVTYCSVCGQEIDRFEHQYGASMYSSDGSGGAGNSNFSAYNNDAQQETAASYVVNKGSSVFHRPSCSDVPKIAPQNYSTSNESREVLISLGYKSCGHCNS